ncbi:MAG: Exoenzyme S synthesis regulatory protein ExsA [Syntrophorhabdus sp. PtaU1.Bin050]|nr:MAG: Exoenzyme S synthesis regulatory protein ExsA [Syntrophorhabdus sp. PtaU1.Bin050]
MRENEQARLERANILLKEKLLSRLPQPGRFPTEIEGLMIARRHDAKELENCVYNPLVVVVVQGSKRSVIGSEEFRYGENHCLVIGVDMPSANHVITASPEKPFLAVTLDLDKYLITQLAAQTLPPPRSENKSLKGVAVTEVDPDLMDAFLRLVELLDKPEQIPVLASMIVREIHYRLLIGPQGERLRMVNTLGTQSNQIARILTWLRDNYKEPLQVDELARKANMATSTFHRRFRELTTISPLQFQKCLRLYEAQRMMLVENEDASVAAMAVGYESPTQFSREYKRMFGEPPYRHVNRLR